MIEILAYYILTGVAVMIISILRYNANPQGSDIPGAILLWPLLLLQLIGSFFKDKE